MHAGSDLRRYGPEPPHYGALVRLHRQIHRNQGRENAREPVTAAAPRQARKPGTRPETGFAGRGGFGIFRDASPFIATRMLVGREGHCTPLSGFRFNSRSAPVETPG